jgi:uncharacterized protein (TIGR02099 family)
VQRLLATVVVAAWSLLLISWLTLHWGILPHIDEWRPTLEKRVSKALGLTVRIGHIEVRSSAWVPALELRDVVLSDAQGRQALRLPLVTAALAPRSLLTLQPRLAQLYIEGAELDVRRDRDGRLHVGGIDMDAGPLREDASGLDWFLRQQEFVIRHGTLRWIDEQRAAPPLLLHSVDLVMRNGLLQHDLRLDATPPPGWGQRFTVRARFNQPLLARPGDWRRWGGTVYADLPGADVAEVRRQVGLPFNLSQGVGALRGWIEVNQGQWRAATLDLALRDVSLRLAPRLDPLAFDRLRVRLGLARQADRLHLTADGLDFTSAQGWHWPASHFAFDAVQPQDLTQAMASAAPVTAGSFQADRLDLASMAHIASRLPLPDALRRELDTLAPQGQVIGLQARWEGPPQALTRYRVQARLADLTMAALPSPQAGHVGRPGWQHADVQLDADQAGGRARLTVSKGALDLPGVFDDPVVPLDHLSAQLRWTVGVDPSGRTPPRIEVQVRDARFDNPDMQGSLRADWHTGPGLAFAKGGRFPGALALQGRIAQGRADRVARYLPLAIPAQVRDYVGRAVRGGRLTDVDFSAKGDLWALPSPEPSGDVFRIDGHVQDASFAYVPADAEPGGLQAAAPSWPPFTALDGELSFDHATMRIRNAKAQLGGMALKNIHGGIDNLATHPVLKIEGAGRGPLTDALGFVRATPIGGWTGHALEQVAATGDADLKLALAVPLDDVAHTRVQGSLVLAGNDVALRPDVPLLAGASGRVDFSEQGFSVVGGSARSLGGDLTFAGGTQPDGSLRFTAQGAATADALRRTSPWPGLARLATLMNGQAAYGLQLGFVDGQTEIALTSNLAGMALALPAPLHKPASAVWPLRLQTALVPGRSAAQGFDDVLQVELGSILQADYLRRLTPAGPQVISGTLNVHDALPGPAAGPPALEAPGGNGVRAEVQLGELDLDAWRQALEPLMAPATPDTPAATAAGDGSLAGYLPFDVHLVTPVLTLFGRTLNAVDAQGQRRLSAADPQAADAAPGEAWRVDLRSAQAQGRIEYRPAAAAGAPDRPGPGRIYARLSRLALPPTATQGVETLLDQASTRVPALDIVIDDFELTGKHLGRLDVLAVNRPAEGVSGSTWQLTRLNLAVPEAHLSATGHWAGSPRREMALDFKLDLADAGAFLQRLGLGQTLQGGKGDLHGHVTWTGSPLALDYPSLAGDWQLNLDNGRFLKADPGAARLLGVLSLQSLPRRLALDFRDVFEQGFVFDNVNGDVQIAQGVARTTNLRLRGVQAAVLMEGSADLLRETQDLRVVVVPEINAGTASLAYAAINPAIGVGTFLAQLFLRRPLMQAGTREFHITGPWADPVVQSVEHHEPAPSKAARPAGEAALPVAPAGTASALPPGSLAR